MSHGRTEGQVFTAFKELIQKITIGASDPKDAAVKSRLSCAFDDIYDTLKSHPERFDIRRYAA